MLGRIAAIGALVLSAATGLSAPSVAQTEPRLALLIGNQDYPGDPPRLRRPHRDVETLERALEAAEFDVVTLRDADRAAIEAAVEAFAERLRAAGPASVGFFYYAGHGAVATAQSQRRNFMLPAGGAFSSEAAVAQRGVRLDLQIDALQTARPGALIVVYDACRNAFTREAGGRGIAVEVPRGGLLLAMSTMADATTPDDGAYAVALAEEIARPGQSAEVAFINASRAVGAGRPIDQLPTVSPALSGAFCFRGCAGGVDPSPPALDPARTLWEQVQGGDDPADFQVIVDRYPESPYADLARNTIARLSGSTTALAPSGSGSGTAPGGSFGITAATPAGTVFRDPVSSGDQGPEMVVVPAGSFTMGSPLGEEGRDAFEGPRTVTIRQPFAVGRFEVTRGQFAAFVSATGHDAGNTCGAHQDGSWDWRDGLNWRNPGFSQTDAHPVACVSWEDAQAYARWLSGQTGETYRLLTEAEWEYAARARTSTAYPWGARASHEQANYGADACCSGLASGRDQWVNTAPAGSFAANAFGLHDMHGNVWEWVEDCYTDGYMGAPSNGSAATSSSCSYHVYRGGAWYSVPEALRSADRVRNGRSNRGYYLGFRLARTL